MRSRGVRNGDLQSIRESASARALVEVRMTATVGVGYSASWRPLAQARAVSNGHVASESSNQATTPQDSTNRSTKA